VLLGWGFVCYEQEASWRTAANLMTKDEARRGAEVVAIARSVLLLYVRQKRGQFPKGEMNTTG
jgi:hypothetical protein